MKAFKLVCKEQELQLKGTLNGGQSFRWKNTVIEGTERWTGVFARKVWVLEQTDDYINYQVYEKEPSKSSEYDKLLRDYFQLDLISLKEYYPKWSENDPYFKEAAEHFYGVRILQQDPVENIFSFICSQNNHITRISSMVEKLATFYGHKICNLNDVIYYTFPSVEDLAQPGVEKKLRENGFGYRAKYIATTAQQIVEQGGQKWLENLKSLDYHEARKHLVGLTGIGPKVADCICLMSLGHLEAIPVDTHMYQIAARFYMPKLAKQKTVTDKIYNEIGDHFRRLYGPLAGWAHTVLFCADLKKFKLSENKLSKIKTKKSKA